jgi:hypothetical protein
LDNAGLRGVQEVDWWICESLARSWLRMRGAVEVISLEDTHWEEELRKED